MSESSRSSNLSESKDSWTENFPPQFSVVCVRNRDAPRSLSLDTCFIGRILYYSKVNDTELCHINLFLRPDLFPLNVDVGHRTLDRYREVVFDYRGCIGKFSVDDIITECVIFPGDFDCSVESAIQKCKSEIQTNKPIFVVRSHLSESNKIQPLRASTRKRMAAGNMDVLSEKGVNTKGKEQLASKDLKSPKQVSRRRITVQESENNGVEDAKENIGVSDSTFQSSLTSPPPSGSSSNPERVSRVRRSLVSDLDGPPVKQSRGETEDKSSFDNTKTRLHCKIKDDMDEEDPVDDKSKSTSRRSPSPEKVRRSARKNKCNVYLAENLDSDSEFDPGLRQSARKNKCTVHLSENYDSESGTRPRSTKKTDKKSVVEKPGSSRLTPKRRKVPNEEDDVDIISVQDDPIFLPRSQDEKAKTRTPRAQRTSTRTPRKSYKEQEDSDFCLSPEFLPSKHKLKTDDSPARSRTSRSQRTPSRYCELDSSPDKNSSAKAPKTPNQTEKTPKKTPKASSKTPSKSPKTPKAKTPSEASSKGCYTPSMPIRASAPLTPMSSLEQVRKNLHVSAVPMSLPCREAEYRNIYHFLENKIRDNTGGCMYISGVPGTGKTATVNAVVRSLKREVEQKKLRDFQYIEVNGLRMTEPRQVFVQVLKSLTGQKSTPQQAQDILAQRFCSGSSKNKTVVLLVDEVDMLRNRRQDVIYNLFDWPSKANSHFIVLTIANTMDLPERLLKGRVTSRLGLTRLTFQPYSYKQLQEIVMSRIAGSNSFNDDAVELVARKVAACSGDVRRALDICRRASEFVEEGSPVTMPIINKVLSNMMNSANVCSIKACSKLEKLFLQAVVAENERTGVEEATFISVYRQFQSLCALAGAIVINISEAMALLNRLGTSGLLLIEHSRADINQSIFLNVNADDIHYALSQTSST